MTRLVQRSLRQGKVRMSVKLEPEFWSVLEAWATETNCTPSEVVIHILDRVKPPHGELTSAVRVAVLQWAMEAYGG